MSAPARTASDRHALVMHLSVPAEGHLRGIAGELAMRVAEHLGADASDVAVQVDGLASRLAPSGHPGRAIAFEFRQVEGALVIEARCDGETAEVRHPLPD